LIVSFPVCFTFDIAFSTFPKSDTAFVRICVSKRNAAFYAVCSAEKEKVLCTTTELFICFKYILEVKILNIFKYYAGQSHTLWALENNINSESKRLYRNGIVLC